MHNIKKLYFYYTFNIPNIIIISLSIFILMIIFNLYDFEFNLIDYHANILEYHDEYLNTSIQVFIPISMMVILLVISIDYMTNHKRFDLIFSSVLESKDILKIKLKIYLLFSFVYMTFIYLLMILFACMRFECFRFNYEMFKIFILINLIGFRTVLLTNLIIRITRIGFSSIIVIIMYFLSLILLDYNEILSDIFFTTINISNCSVKSNIFLSIIVILVYNVILTGFFASKEYK